MLWTQEQTIDETKQITEATMARENEAEAVRTTIVGGRPPGSGRSNVPVPRGIEVLVKKAAVDAEFRKLLLLQRGRAAASIQLELDPAESAMLSAIPQEQLARIVEQTEVATELRPAFAGRVGAVMLAALGAGLVTSSVAKPANVLPDQPREAASAPEVSTSKNPTLLAQGQVIFGNRAYWPASPPPTNPPPTNPPPPAAVFGVRMTPPTNPPPTNPPPKRPPGAVIRGIQPSRPPVAIAGVMPVPPPTNPPATNPPSTNAAPPKTAPGSDAGVQPNYSLHVVAGVGFQVPPPKAPKTNAPDTNPPARKPEEQK
jgi:hypothetical protein